MRIDPKRGARQEREREDQTRNRVAFENSRDYLCNFKRHLVGSMHVACVCVARWTRTLDPR